MRQSSWTNWRSLPGSVSCAACSAAMRQFAVSIVRGEGERSSDLLLGIGRPGFPGEESKAKTIEAMEGSPHTAHSVAFVDVEIPGRNIPSQGWGEASRMTGRSRNSIRFSAGQFGLGLWAGLGLGKMPLFPRAPSTPEMLRV